MRKEQFIYELIDKYLYYVNINTIVMENYTCKERTAKCLAIAIEGLKSCLDFYDKMIEEINAGRVDEATASVKLEYIVAWLSNEEKKSMLKELNRHAGEYITDIDEFLEKNLLFDTKGQEQVISQKTMEAYIITLRQKEESEICDNT